ncbi:MAG: four helix bundle protein [Bacteroidota bacterium]
MKHQINHPNSGSKFRTWKAYQKSRKLANSIFLLTKTFPKEETYSLIDQIRRSSRAVGANLAESFAKRRYPKHFIAKLTDASGENYETQAWLDAAYDAGYLSDAHFEQYKLAS